MDDLHAVKTALRTDGGARGLEQPSTTKKQHGHCNIGAVAICELGNALNVTLQVKDDNSDTSADSPSDEDGNSGLEDEDPSNYDLKVDGSTATLGKCLHKCATFPVSIGSEGKDSESQLETKGCTRSLSMPAAARKIVSAMKGSREKEGVPQKKLSVTWAPDVYDPPPTSVSHYPRKKSQQHYKSSKKHGKGKQKGKSSRGGGSAPKEKKHHRKSSGRSGRCLDCYTDSDRVQNYKPSLELLSFNNVGDGIGSPDPNCGSGSSSFLGQARGSMHCVC